MYIVKVEDDMEYDGLYTTIIGAFLTEEKAAEYCKQKNSVFRSLRDKVNARIRPSLDRDFILTLTPEEKEMYDSEDSRYVNPEWTYEELKMIVR